jgi:2-polyprenyl-3-methyl-5-hydroxy-6-metoxy-1,4-benzoquinol methylase
MSAEFDKLANSYDNWHEDLIKGSGFGREYFLEYKVKETYRVLQRQNFQPKTILDFGCGVGDVEPFLQKYFPESEINGVDISESSISTAKAKALKNVKFAALNENWIEENTLANFGISYDLVFIAGVFHHVPPAQHSAILSAIKAQMNHGAKIFIFELNPYNPATRHVFSKYEIPVDKNANLIKPANIKNLLANNGFKTSRKIYTIFFPHFLRFMIPFERFLSFVPFGAHYYLYGENI